MKRVIFTAALVAFVASVSLPNKASATGNDTLVVYASGPTLDEVINGDTTSTGQQAHGVYELVSLDTTYVFLSQVTPRSDATFIGVLGSDGRPPCIQPGVLQDGSVPGILFNLARTGLVETFKNLFVEDLSTNGSCNSNDAIGSDIRVSADSVKVYVDNVIFDYNHTYVIGYTGSWNDFFITNCKFRNGVNPITWTDSQILAAVWPSVPPLDTAIMRYNTIFCNNSYACSPGYPIRYFEFSHNDVVYSFLQPFAVFTANAAKIDNNVFYGVFVGGETKAEYPWWDEMFSPEVPSVISFDTMNAVSDSVFDPADNGKSNWRMLAEAKRNVEVENNVYFQPQAITAFWNQWDDTVSAGSNDSLYTPLWMNPRTTRMFGDPTRWTGFKESGNLINTDPGYGSSLVNVINGGTVGHADYGLGLLSYFTLIRKGQSPATGWGYQIQSISGTSTNWIPYWPLPEEISGDLKYTASLTAPDGKPYGDPYWFNGLTGIKQQPTSVPAKFDLSNNYPNPFNPSTTIKVSLAKSGVMSLKIYNILGQVVRVVDEGNRHAGEYTYNITMDEFASGVYFYTLQQGPIFTTKKMLLLK